MHMHACTHTHTLHICHMHMRAYTHAHTHTHLNVCATKHADFCMEVKHIFVPWKVGLSSEKYYIVIITSIPLNGMVSSLEENIVMCTWGWRRAWWSYGDVVEFCFSY